MAIVKAPLMSLGARGQLGKTLVMSVWKGIKTAREYVIPANPRTQGQVAQRAKMADVVAFFRASLTNAAMRTGWNLTATLSGVPQSGFNAYTAAALAWLKALNGSTLTGVPQLWVGSTPQNLTFAASGESSTFGDSFATAVAFDTGSVNWSIDSIGGPSSPGTLGITHALTGTNYLQLVMVAGGVAYPMSGITKLTV